MTDAKQPGALVRLLAGLMGPRQQPNFAPQSPSPFSVPFTGLRNEPAPPDLPAFEQPGQMMAQYQPPIPTASRQGDYGQAWGAPAPMPQQAPQMPMPMPPSMAGGQGFGGPEPAPGSIPPAYDPNMDPRFLPEQLRGAFNNWQFPS